MKRDGNIIRIAKGQTLIETIFMLTLLLLLFFVIAEFARAWYLKNSLNNAVRVGARVAVVSTSVASGTTLIETCPGSGNEIIAAVCSSSGIPEGDTTVKVEVLDDDGVSGLTPGDTVNVSASAIFNTVVPNFLTFAPEKASSIASMRHE